MLPHEQILPHYKKWRGIDDLGRVVIPKEIRRTMRIREGDPSQTTLTLLDRFWFAIYSVAKRKAAE